jgi:hypothetical protein
MSAIITDQLRISNAKKFISEVRSSSNSYYAFVGLPNAKEYSSDWDVTPLSPRDNFDQENDYWDTIIGLSKILPDNARQVIRKSEWQSGAIYDMYRHDISIDNVSPQSEATSLYSSNYYVVNSDLKVYICLNNGASPENNFKGNLSLDEPKFTDLEPRAAGNSGDGYVWKYLYTIKPSDIIKFDSLFFITTPLDWETNSETQAVRNNALTSGQLKTIVIKNRGVDVGNSNTTYTGIPIKGDGTGAEATIVINSQRKVESILVSKGGSGYTYGSVDFASGGIVVDSDSGENPEFDVIIPPRGGHGYDIYRELGASSVLLYARIENNTENPDFIVGNEISRFGIVENPTQYNSENILTNTTVSATYALKLIGVVSDDEYKEADISQDTYFTQTIDTNEVSVGRVISYDKNTGVLKYWQDRRLVGFNTDGSKNSSPSYGFNMNRFTSSPASGNLNIEFDSGLILKIDSSFNGSTQIINNNTYQLGQTFINGISNPEVEKYSGDIIYIDNRPSITRSPNQKEDIKVILQF